MGDIIIFMVACRVLCLEVVGLTSCEGFLVNIAYCRVLIWPSCCFVLLFLLFILVLKLAISSCNFARLLCGHMLPSVLDFSNSPSWMALKFYCGYRLQSTWLSDPRNCWSLWVLRTFYNNNNSNNNRFVYRHKVVTSEALVGPTNEKPVLRLPLEISQTNRHKLPLHTHRFNGPFSGTTRVGRYQKGKTNLDFTEARDIEWQWHQLGPMQVCTSLQTDNLANTPLLSLSFFTGRMPFLPPN